MSELHTFDDMWEELKNQNPKFYTEVELLADWLMSRPRWWQFKKRRAWRKAKPKLGGADHE